MYEFKSISIIGMGLIGGSIALALNKAGYKGKVIGKDLNIENIQRAQQLNLISKAADSVKEAVEDVDLVIIATPLQYYEELIKEMSTYISKTTIITDVGSVKGYVHELAKKHLPKDAIFIGGHPMAGSEKSGITAANPYLFENAYYFLTHEDETLSSEAMKKLKNFVEFLGAYPVPISIQKHDQIVSRISHTPHLMAVVLSNMLDIEKNISYIPFVGGGFRDTTRIASGNPEMWRDIFLLNRNELIKGIESCEGLLKEFKSLLEDENAIKINELLNKAKLIRDSIPKHRKDSMPQIFEIIIGVEDRPGILGELTKILGDERLNIKDIEILHARQDEQGAVKIGFETKDEQLRAYKLLKNANYHLTYIREDNENANHK